MIVPLVGTGELDLAHGAAVLPPARFFALQGFGRMLVKKRRRRINIGPGNKDPVSFSFFFFSFSRLSCDLGAFFFGDLKNGGVWVRLGQILERSHRTRDTSFSFISHGVGVERGSFTCNIELAATIPTPFAGK